MKVILEILLLKYLFFVTLASPRAKIENFPSFSTEEKIADYDIKGKSNDYKNFEFYRRSIQEHTLEENKRRSDYFTYYFRNPTEDNELYQEDDSSDLSDSFDSTIENVEWVGNNNNNKHSTHSKRNEISEKPSNQKHKKNKNTSSDSSESNVQSNSNSHGKNVNRKRKDTISNKHGKINFDNSDDLDSIENDSRENSFEELSQSLEQNETQNFKTTLSKKDNSKIKSFLKKLNKSSCCKKLLDSKNEPKIDTDIIFQEPDIKKWRKVKNVIKLVLIDNYKYIEKIILSEIIQNKQTSRHQISKLEVKLLHKYYLLKKNISQILKDAKKTFKEDLSKETLSKKKIHEVEKLYLTQLKNQIVEKIFAFKEDIKSEVDQFQLELKRDVDYTENQNIKSTAVQKETNAKRPFDSLSENESIIDHEMSLSSAVNIISAGHVTSLEILESSLTGTNKSINHSDSLTDLNSVSLKSANRVTLPSDSEPLKNRQKPSNLEKVNSRIDESMGKENEFIDSVADGENPFFEIDNLSKSDTSSKAIVSVIAGNKTVIIKKSHGLLIKDTAAIDNNNLQQEHLTTTHIGNVAATTKNEIDTNLRNNSAKPIATAVSDDAGSLSSLSHALNMTQIKNIAIGKKITSDTENSANLKKLSQIDHPETSMMNNNKLIKPLSDSHVAGNSLSVNQHAGVTNDSSVVKNQINGLNQHNVTHIDIPNHVQESRDVTFINNRIDDAKVVQKPSETNIDSTQYNIVNDHNRSAGVVNDTYDSQKYESIFNITNIDGNPMANSSINEYSTTTTGENEISQGRLASNIEIFSNLDQQNQVQIILKNAAENVVNKRKTITPIDGNIGNISAQSNLDVIPLDVNTENIQNTSDINKIPRMNANAAKSDINVTNHYEATKSIDDNLQTENSHALLNAETTFELQNVKENINDSEKQQNVNDIANDFIMTSYHNESTTRLNNNDQVNVAHNKTKHNSKTENITPTDYSHDNRETTDTIISYHSMSLNALTGSAGSISDDNKNINFTDNKPVTQTTVAENIAQKLNDLYISNGAATNINQLIETQTNKTTQMDPSKNNSYYNEASTPSSAKTGQQLLDKNIFNDTIKLIINETSAIDSTSITDKIVTNTTKILDSGYHAIDTNNSLDITTDKGFYAEPKVKETANDNKIINPTVSTPPVDSESLQSNLNETITSTIKIEKSPTNTILEETNISTPIMPENKVNTTECTDAKGAIVDCESLILSSSGNDINKNANIENKKSTMNVWPGIPQACLPLFLASEGTVLKEIPLTVNVADAQTRNLCLSIAKTIIQLNYPPNME